MRTWTRTIGAITTIVMTTALTACGGEGSGPSAGKSYDIAFVASIKGEPFFYSMNCGVKDEAKKLGVTTTFTAGDAFDPNVQTPIFNATTAKHPDAALVVPVDAKAMIPPLREMKSAGIKIVELDTSVEDASLAESAIATDNHQGGVLAAQTLAKLVGDKGKVLVINVQPGISSVDARQKGFLEEMAKHPGIKMLQVQYAGFDAAKAASITSATLSAHPDLAGVYATASILGEGTATGVQQAGKAGGVKVVAFDAGPKLVEQFQAGRVQGLITQDPYGIGVEGVRQAVAALKGEPVKKKISMQAVAVTKDNAAQMTRYFYRPANC